MAELVLPVPLVLLVKTEELEQLVIQDPLDLKDEPDLLDRQVHKAEQEALVQLV